MSEPAIKSIGRDSSGYGSVGQGGSQANTVPSAVIKTYYCPSRRAPIAVNNFGMIDYSASSENSVDNNYSVLPAVFLLFCQYNDGQVFDPGSF